MARLFEQFSDRELELAVAAAIKEDPICIPRTKRVRTIANSIAKTPRQGVSIKKHINQAILDAYRGLIVPPACFAQYKRIANYLF